MAGALTISTLNDSSGVLATQNGMTGIAKAWVIFNGTTSPGTILGSFNVGSVTKIGTGQYTVNFTTAMPDANYATLAQLCPTDGTFGNMGDGVIVGATFTVPYTGTYSTTAVSLACGASAARDYNKISVAVHR